MSRQSSDSSSKTRSKALAEAEAMSDDDLINSFGEPDIPFEGTEQPSEPQEAETEPETPAEQEQPSQAKPDYTDINPQTLLHRLPQAPSAYDLTVEILRISKMLSFYEYQYRLAQADAAKLKDHYDISLLMTTAKIDAKTETAKKALALEHNPALEKMLQDLADIEAYATKLGGIRDALRTSYETVSRIVAIKQLELDMNRAG